MPAVVFPADFDQFDYAAHLVQACKAFGSEAVEAVAATERIVGMLHASTTCGGS